MRAAFVAGDFRAGLTSGVLDDQRTALEVKFGLAGQRLAAVEAEQFLEQPEFFLQAGDLVAEFLEFVHGLAPRAFRDLAGGGGGLFPHGWRVGKKKSVAGWPRWVIGARKGTTISSGPAGVSR